MNERRYTPREQLEMLKSAFPELLRESAAQRLRLFGMSHREIHWRDMAGRVHRCHLLELEERIVVTSCKFDVPPGEAYEMEPSDPIEAITCPLCLSGETWGGTVAERLGLPPKPPREP